MDNFRDSYFQVDWDLTSKRLKGTYWGKQYDTGRGFAVTVINGGQVVTPSTEVLRLKWEKPDNTSGYVNATIVNGKFIVENIDQMFTVHGSVRADFELSVGGKFVASITFYVNVEKAVAVDAIESSSEFTALQTAIGTVDGLDAQLAQIEQQLEDGTAGIDDSVISDSKVWSSSKTQQEIGNLINIPSTVYTSDTQPPNPSEGDIWFKIISSAPELPVTDYLFRFDASELQLDDGAKVAQWDDMSANGYDITQTTANLQPLYLAEGFNGKPTVKFDGSILSKTPFNLDNVNGATIFLVAQVDVGGSSASIVTVGQTTTNVKAIGLRYSGSGAMIATYIQAPSVALSSASTSLNTPYLLTTTFDMVETKMYKNGAYQTKAPYTSPIGDHTILAIGRSPYDAIPEPFTGRISELMYFSRCLSEQEITELNSYLMQKWGI